MPTDNQLNAYLDQLRAGVAEHGWMIQGVFPASADDPPAFAYTVGLHPAHRAELVISGLPAELSAQILNAAAKKHLDQELKPGDDVYLQGVTRVVTHSVWGFVAPAPLRPINTPRAEVTMARKPLRSSRPVTATAVARQDRRLP